MTTSTATSTRPFVVARTNRAGRETWQINGAGPHLTIKNASQALSDMATQPPRGATILEAHRLPLVFDVRHADGSTVECVALWGKGSSGGWCTREQWAKDDALLASSRTGQCPAF